MNRSTEWSRRKRAAVHAAMGGACARADETCKGRLEAHHLDHDGNTHRAARGTWGALDDLAQGRRPAALLCASHHRREHRSVKSN